MGPKCPIKLLPVKQASDCGTDITGKTTVYPGAAAEPEITDIAEMEGEIALIRIISETIFFFFNSEIKVSEPRVFMLLER